MTAFERREKNIVDLQPNHIKRYVSYMIYGLWVHFRVFPILLLPMLVMYEFHSVKKGRWRHLFKYLLEFGLISGGVFIALSVYYYSLYGYDFLHETYFYHLTRRDNRHSRSVFFYDLYLNYEGDATLKPLWRVIGRNLPSWCFLAFFWVYLIRKRSYFFCQGFLICYFVLFNRVVTDQYYMWLFSFLYLVIP
jgi:GPI mannosyltransferase 1 subunit M